MATEFANAHEQLLARLQPALASFLSEKLVAGTDEPRWCHNAPERYLAMKIPKKVWGILPGHDKEKIFAAYPWEPSVGCVMCYLSLNRTGLLEEVKRVIHAFHEDTKVHVILTYEVRGHEPTNYCYPQTPLSLPPPLR